MAAGARQVEVAILGAGFSGLAVARELERTGLCNYAILERGGSVGGTWRDNSYPGCACDVPSHLYSLSFGPRPDWSRAYAPQPEIRAYLEACADALGVRPHIELGREAVSAAWDEAGWWRVRLRSGEELLARAVVAATGALSNPAWAELPGRERFRGAQFHSAGWDHGFDLAGRRVAVVGTGASAIQFIPRIQPLAARLYVLQRTPPWILPRRDRAFRPWERALLRGVRPARWLYRQAVFWRLEGRALAFVEHPALMRLVAWAARRHLARAVRDPALRERLTPRYRPGCKRILLADDYYPAITRPNVELVTAPIEGVLEGGLRLAGGRLLEVDAIIHGTGFAVHRHLGGLSVTGRGGVTLSERWRGGAEAYLGTMVAGFPNLFLMTGPNTGLGHNSMLVMIEGQARWIARALRLARRRGAATVEPREEAEREWAERIRRRTARSVWASGCRSWYLDPQGRNTTLWPGFASGFRARLARLRPAELRLGPAGRAA
ncbi:MAG TPA: NAD(P)/FAD-dependent oxidoreductase [Anaeromyxobacteraceae bacterium]|nr:NAD(P)/FAD-dependent oxidoreductase [Anaeromyxobacteraceae bacterium]